MKSVPGANEAAIADVSISLEEGETTMLHFKQRLGQLALNAFRNPPGTVQAGLGRRGPSSIQ